MDVLFMFVKVMFMFSFCLLGLVLSIMLTGVACEYVLRFLKLIK
jgi:hypothetical protein